MAIDFFTQKKRKGRRFLGYDYFYRTFSVPLELSGS